jgi:hypothetical protein
MISLPQDTWASYPGQATEQARVTHGTFFYLASEEGLIANNSVHAGIRCKLGVSPTYSSCFIHYNRSMLK